MTQFSDIMKIIKSYIPEEMRSRVLTDYSFTYSGCYAMYVTLGIEEDDIVFDEETKTGYCGHDLSMAEKWLAALYSYKAYLDNLKLTYVDETIGIKTITFELKSLDKKPDAINDSLYRFERWIDKEIKKATGGGTLIGKARMMKVANE